jgi:hypothetical protein
MIKFNRILFLLLFLAALNACGNKDAKQAETATEQATKESANNPSGSTETNALKGLGSNILSNAASGVGRKLDTPLPEGFELPSGYELVTDMEQESNGKKVRSVGFFSKETPKELSNLITKMCEDKAYKKQSSMVMGESLIIEFKKEKHRSVFMINSNPDTENHAAFKSSATFTIEEELPNP